MKCNMVVSETSDSECNKDDDGDDDDYNDISDVGE